MNMCVAAATVVQCSLMHFAVCCWNVFSKVNWKVCRGSADP